jgi:exodeoxyribonuclease VII large subunit
VNEVQEAPILTVSQLTGDIKNHLENNFPSLWLQGEISNAKMHTSGHFYFSLKDATSQIGAVMFRGNASSLKVTPKDGDKVIVHGCLNVFPPSGKYQIVVDQLKLAGIGELLLKLEELKQKLNKLGWFKKERKRPLPKFPKRIGVVTSPTGAAIQDILHILTRRFSGFHLILNPVRVQGEGAAKEIAQAINDFNTYELADVLIVGRGGGSFEDLWAFNEEIVAEAVFNSKIPIVCAVGHETDHCIAEYVADVRAPTPSAAAEIVIGERLHQIKFLEQTQQRLLQTVKHLLRHYRHRFDGILRQPVFRNPYAILGTWMQKLDDSRQMLDQSVKQLLIQKNMMLEGRKKVLQSIKPTAVILQYRNKLSFMDKQLNNLWNRNFSLRKERLQKLIEQLKSIDPKNLLRKGFSILFSEKDQSVITSVEQLTINQNLKILLSDGEAISIVKDVIHGNKR